MNNNISNLDLCEWYFTTKFEVPILPSRYPNQFAIITAYNPFNQLLENHENIARNQILKNQLEKSYDWVYEINGFDKSSKHKENGFMFDAKSLDEACDLGEEFSQDAIYYVIDDTLYVSKCEKSKRYLTKVGDFQSRIY
ncbi:DUF3293 domain-containing protein [Francisella philomiragia]|uniref:DUF3293 domain-containing protein n=1 Tax=Francisella philomiragia TaxID=28110 RepID=A0A0B6CPY6_9GAMM|nr:DUF3293 domain-containing protein [Francisella philomiragia]AJI52539.1 hypothetical protein LA55_1030 [Francisella philomiragia]MBY7733567.1 DUF3293 domain-containing protein [Francisella philomiragia]